jgi:hypothetical protein
MLVVERAQGTARLLGHCRIHRIGSTQAVLGRQRSGLVTQSHIERHHGHIREPSQGRRERFRSHRIVAGPTDGPATSANTKFGTMIGSARVRSTWRSCRLVA